MADNTSNEHDKRAWLRLAASWMRMVRKEAGQVAVRPRGHDAFAEYLARGTRQRDSRSSH
jgi:predicted ATP-grasp superfamily ATP-dependent carboligase